MEPDAGLVGAHSADLWQLNILLLQLAPCLLEDGIHNLLGRHTAHAHSSCEEGKIGLMQGSQQGLLSPILTKVMLDQPLMWQIAMKQGYVRNVALGGAAADG